MFLPSLPPQPQEQNKDDGRLNNTFLFAELLETTFDLFDIALSYLDPSLALTAVGVTNRALHTAVDAHLTRLHLDLDWEKAVNIMGPNPEMLLRRFQKLEALSVRRHPWYVFAFRNGYAESDEMIQEIEAYVYSLFGVLPTCLNVSLPSPFWDPGVRPHSGVVPGPS